MSFLPRLLPTGIGSLPHRDAGKAISFIERHVSHVPFWPQLPKRTEGENMYLQFSLGIPGFKWQDGKGTIDLAAAEEEVLAFYEAQLEGSGGNYPLREYAAGYDCFLSRKGGWPDSMAVKGHVTGPVSLGLSLADASGKPVLYDETAMDIVTRHLACVASGQERELSRLSSTTIVFLDEPYMSTYGSAYFPYGRDLVIQYITQALSGLKGIKGVHCCGNTDWDMVMETPVDLLSFDAYDYLEQFCLYAPRLGGFLENGGYLAWGLVPRVADAGGENPEGLAGRFQKGLDLLVARGVDAQCLVERSFLTPACGLGGLDEELAEGIFSLLTATSSLLRKKYNLSREGEG